MRFALLESKLLISFTGSVSIPMDLESKRSGTSAPMPLGSTQRKTFRISDVPEEKKEGIVPKYVTSV